MTQWTNRDIKTLKDNPNDYPTDDMQVALSTAKLHPVTAPNWDTYDFGLGGPEFAVLCFDIDEAIDFSIQTSHTMMLNTILDNHVHGTLPSNDAGKKIKWQLDVIAAGIGEPFAAVEGSPFTKEFTLKGAEANRHNMLDIADIPAVNTTVSSIYLCTLTRIAASSDDYGEQVYLLFNDSHYQKDSDGSYFEGAKLTDEYAKMKGTPSKPFKSGAW